MPLHSSALAVVFQAVVNKAMAAIRTLILFMTRTFHASSFSFHYRRRPARAVVSASISRPRHGVPVVLRCQSLVFLCQMVAVKLIELVDHYEKVIELLTARLYEVLADELLPKEKDGPAKSAKPDLRGCASWRASGEPGSPDAI
jgi:hypothetical protein